jgi:ABC-type dipeptide/oligopeptide/nickel transport system permease subunit
VALFGQRLAPHESIYFVVEHGADPRPYDPGIVFPFGSDVLGRDLFSLVLAGARTTLEIVLLAGAARVASGVFVAAIGGWWRPLRLLTEWLSELVSAVPATIVALVIVRVLGRSETSIPVFIGALLLMGWAGPYRVVRAEVDRLAHAPFTLGAQTLGISRWRMFWRHQLPHLVPVIAVNLSQQVVASLVLLAELGVLGTLVGTTRSINIEESLSVVRTGPLNIATIADPPEWGGLLANARTIESLWTTRWLIVVPGLAFAATSIAVALIGFGLARRYARRDVLDDVRGFGTAAFVALVLALVVVSAIVPERYAQALETAAAARSALTADTQSSATFAAAGLRPIGEGFGHTIRSGAVVQAAPATVRIGSRTLTETGLETLSNGARSLPMRAFVSALTGGGTVEAPLVFAGRGISPADYPPQPRNFFGPPDVGQVIANWADDYATIDVRGKIVVLVRFAGVAGATSRSFNNGNVLGPSVDESIANAIKRGAAGVLFVDPALPQYTADDPGYIVVVGDGILAGVDPYLRLERALPPTTTGGVPVVVLETAAAASLLNPLGLDIASFARHVQSAEDHTRPAGRDLGVSARIDVPLEDRIETTTSYVSEVPGFAPDVPHILIWAPRQRIATPPAADVLAAAAVVASARRQPFVFVDFEAGSDESASRRRVAELLTDRHISLVVVLGRLDGPVLQLTTPYGDLIPAFDQYAEAAGARHQVTRTTPPLGALSGIAPLTGTKTVLLSGGGGTGDLRPDAAALVGYLVGRVALGAEELPR